MSIKKRGDSYYYDFGVRGIRYRGVIAEARTKYQAEQAEARIRDSVFEGKYGLTQGKTKFDEFAEKVYLLWAESSKRTSEDDRFHIKTLVNFFGNMPLGNITQLIIERFKRERAASKVRGGAIRKPASINRELAVLSKLLSLARDNGFLKEKPKVKLLREDNHRNRYLTESEEEQLMESLENSRTYLCPLITVGLDTGMRLGEIERLRPQDLDFQRDSIYVATSKNGKSRSVPMTERVSELLLALSASDRELVFENLPQVSKAFTQACRKAGIEDFHFHDLRHTFATRLADSGVDAVTIAALLGHSSIQMAMRYTHATDDRVRKAVKALDRYGQMPGQNYVTRDNLRKMA